MAKSQTRHPGRPNYNGPDTGYALLVHHGILLERCYGFKLRISYILSCKPEKERAIRLHHLVRLNPSDTTGMLKRMWVEYIHRKAAFDKLLHDNFEADDYGEVATAYYNAANVFYNEMAAWSFSGKPLKLLNKYVPDHKWNGKELVFE